VSRLRGNIVVETPDGDESYAFRDGTSPVWAIVFGAHGKLWFLEGGRREWREGRLRHSTMEAADSSVCSIPGTDGFCPLNTGELGRTVLEIGWIR
jgi:hypothetical protein